MKLLLISHGTFASGLLGSFEMIAGKNEAISAISLTEEGIGDFSKRFKDYLKEQKAEKILILCDLKGGTPFNESYREYLANPSRIRVIAGMNLPMLLELGGLLSSEIDFDELVAMGINVGRDSIEGITDEVALAEELIEF